MQIKLYNTTSEVNRVVKTLSNELDVNGYARGQIDILNPTIIINTSTLNFNYAYITEFGRYYFIDEIVSIKTNLWAIKLRVDVLMSYSSGILNLNCIIKRQENLFNLYLDDEYFKTYNKIRTQIYKFPVTFGNHSNFILSVAGG